MTGRECGCRVWREADEIVESHWSEPGEAEIAYCPIHSAAERLGEMVEGAYREGYGVWAPSPVTPDEVETDWLESDARAALERLKEGRDG